MPLTPEMIEAAFDKLIDLDHDDVPKEHVAAALTAALSAGWKPKLIEAIAILEKELPGWWWRIGNCSVSADASCGPDRAGPDAHLLEIRLFDDGFHADLRHPSDVATALLEVIRQAKEAMESP